MVTKLFLRPQSLPLTAFSPKFIFPHKNSLPICFTSPFSSTTVHSQSQFSHQSLSYGPSLCKGIHPFPSVSRQSPIDHSPPLLKTLTGNLEREQLQDQENEGAILDEDAFTRIFDVAALRVPSRGCFELENRLRGHLLNWPRIRNIARVPGDEVEAEMLELVGEQNWSNSDDGDGTSIDLLHRRIYGKAEGDGEPLSPVLYREKLVKTFDSKGYVNFRHLAKMSRLKRRKEKKEEGRDEKMRRMGKSEFAIVEVVESEELEMDDMKGLLGDGFKGGKWRGSTRLLLLDEQYAAKGVEELPEAIKALLKGDTQERMKPTIELVRCRLTLFYDYWQMNEVLQALLPKDMIIPSAFETVGHIAHLNLRDEHLSYKKLIAKVILDKNKPKIQTVVNKSDAISNDYRTMQLEVLAGNHSLVTTVVENGLRFHLDLATVYWNSRLATERQRLLSVFTCNDVICDVFAGVGPISISAARIVKKVYANDLNPYAVEYLERNSVANKLERKIEVFNMEGRRFIRAMFASEKAPKITQVVMNLPNDAAEYLDAFKGILRDRSDKEFTLPIIHVYGFSKARDPEFDFHERIRIAITEVAVDVNVRRVRLVAPGKWMLCASFRLPRSVALSKPYTSHDM
ncbi:tRNA (guanine(37)-N1)-methyltransferase 1 isoform X1 [Cucumis sativus]|uniref:tRNA (guanine(37)-N1)-methyltransferase n=1 Tax=Cucumis sativus TaxID=3659 RepID=A0A0A0LFW2_CUCSA|nr:tRNA (guanine(37)-N1)-methyltransferase 1 isoform X1 [Cucumis sativus]